MEGELKPLSDTNAYNPSYDVAMLPAYDFDQLDLIKLEIESDLHILSQKLEANGVDMDSPLITSDGFPRSDINIIEVRTARIKIIKLKNDLSAVIDELSKRIADRLQQGPTPITKQQKVSPQVPFAQIVEVIANSPANQAGIQVHDKLLAFGPINATNHNNLKSVAQIVQANVNKEISLVVLRDGSHLDITLTPTTNWPGQGLLGCRLTQL